MVEFILTEPQLVRLKADVTTGSAESAALEAGKRFGSAVFSPEPIAVKCTFAIATRLLAVANRSCPEVVPKIRAAIEQATTSPAGGSDSFQPPRAGGGARRRRRALRS